MALREKLVISYRYEVTFYLEDFDSEEEWEEFKKDCAEDNEIAHDNFSDNIEKDDWNLDTLRVEVLTEQIDE
jgi:hypothetical protein